MGVTTYEHEIHTSIPPAKMYKAFVLDADNLIPKVLPQAIKSVEIVHGDGGPGTVKKVHFGEGSQYKSVTQRIDAIDEENLTYSYSVLEGDALMDSIDSISYEVKLVPSPDGGSICKTTSKYHAKGDFKIAEEHIKAGKEKALGLFKAVEAHLVAHPDAYN